jgi:hypothetical protein
MFSLQNTVGLERAEIGAGYPELRSGEEALADGLEQFGIQLQIGVKLDNNVPGLFQMLCAPLEREELPG